ncbi:MAG: sugar phosphate isomerase/epimerase [Candidatus Hydrogenedentes bacterium]|nr:sugar phosphate isomerase/epimerase [Candidatus Hydrogenedentota bacterium]
MKTVISALHFDWRDMGECLRVATGELGLDGVELSWHESSCRPHCTQEDLAALTTSSGRSGVALSAHIWDNIAEADHAAVTGSLLGWLKLCRKTGTTDLIIHGGSYGNQKEGIDRARRVFESVLPAFERAHVTLNLENHYAYDYHGCRELFSEPWEFLEVLALDSPSLKFCFDTGHGNMTRNTGELLESLAPWLNYVHMADNRGVDDDHLAYGQGTVAWEDVFARLRSMKFDGVMCVEFPVHEDREPFKACVAEIRRLTSPFDVPGIKTQATTPDILEAVRESRERGPRSQED